jgi:hypothetical protein
MASCKPFPQPKPICNPKRASCRRKVERAVADCLVELAPKRDAYWEKQAKKVKDPRVAALTGRCSVGAEAAFFVLGGHGSMKLHVARLGPKETHWWATSSKDMRTRVDPTARQFPACELPSAYAKGGGIGMSTPRQGFCTPPPSKRSKPVVACAYSRLKRGG